MLLTFKTKAELVRFLAEDVGDTEYLIMHGFQRLRQWTAVPLKALTFLYGPNSAGKSSCSDAIELLRLLRRGESRELSRQVESSRRSPSSALTIGISVRWAPDINDSRLNDLFSYWEKPSFYNEWCADKLPRCRFTWLWTSSEDRTTQIELFRVREQVARLRPEPGSSASLWLNFAEVEATLGQSIDGLTLFDDPWPSVKGKRKQKLDLEEFFWDNLSELPCFGNSPFSPHESSMIGVSDLQSLMVVLFSDIPRYGPLLSNYVGPLRRILTDDELSFHADSISPGDFQDAGNGNRHGDGADMWRTLASSVLKQLVEPTKGSSGGAKRESLLGSLNRWLDDPEHFGLGYQVASSCKLIVPDSMLDKNRYLKKAKVDDIPGLGADVALKLVDTKGRTLCLSDVGAGISQIIPMVIGALSVKAGDLAIFEQPELHLHPKLQSKLCDLFIEATLGRSWPDGRPLTVVESHSEHLLLRLLRRIRESGLQINGTISSDDVAVLYFEPDGDETYVHHLRVCSDGTFADRWPNGFFDERFEDIFGE
jgi:hypothetical protein